MISPATVVTGAAAAELVASQSITQSMASPPRSKPSSQEILLSSFINCFSFPLREFFTSHMKQLVSDLFLVNTSGSLCLTPLGGSWCCHCLGCSWCWCGKGCQGHRFR